jgi:hypothetical protein
MMPMDHEMARMLQEETAREMSQTPVDMHQNKQLHPHPQHQHQHQHQHQMHIQQQPQHFMPQEAQAVYFNAPQQMQFSQQMDYTHAQNMQQSHHQQQHTMVMTSMPHMEPEARKPRQSAGPNENELKDMLHKNLERSLDELAAEVRANEKTSSAEKTKQLFAMLW